MGWIIFGCILAVLIGILCLDLTFTVHYSEAFLISVGVGPFKYGLLVTEEEKAKREAKKEAKGSQKEKAGSEKSGTRKEKEGQTAGKETGKGKYKRNGADRFGSHPIRGKALRGSSQEIPGDGFAADPPGRR